MWFIYSLIGALITGIGQVLVKKGQINLSPLLDNLIATVIVNVVLVPFLIFFGTDLQVTNEVLIYSLIAAIMYSTFYYIISFGKVSIMISLINTFPLITILLAIIFLHELPNIFQWIGILLIATGIFYISKEKRSESIISINYQQVCWGILGACAIGIAEFITKLATKQVSGFTFTLYVYLMYIPPLIIYLIFDKKGRVFKMLRQKSSLIFTVLGILMIEMGLIAIALAYQYGFASLVSPVVATHMLFTALLASFFLKEKLCQSQKIGIGLNLVGIIIIGVLS